MLRDGVVENLFGFQPSALSGKPGLLAGAGTDEGESAPADASQRQRPPRE